MSGVWQGSMDEMLLLLAMGLCTIFAFVFFITALRVRKSEHLDRRLRFFARAGGGSPAKLAPPVRIDLEREETRSAQSSRQSWRVLFGRKKEKKRNLNRRFIRAGIDPVRGKKLCVLVRLLLFVLASLATAFLLS